MLTSKMKRGNAVTYNGQPHWIYSSANHPNYCISDVEDLNEATAENLFNVKLADLKPSNSFNVSSIGNVIKKPTEAKLDTKKALNDFFSRMALKRSYLCMNCNQPLQAFNKF